MQDLNEKIRNPSRRRFLQIGTIAGSLASLPNVAVARSENSPTKDDLRISSRRLVDAKITYPDVEELPEISIDGALPSTFTQNGELFLISVPVSKIQQTAGPILRTPNDVTFLTEVSEYVQRILFKETYVDGRGGIRLVPEEPHEAMSFTIRFDDDEVIIEEDGTTIAGIPIGTERTTSLPSREIKTAEYGDPQKTEIKRPGMTGTTLSRPKVGTRSVMIRPELTVSNHGKVDVYGAKQGPVVPETEKFPIRGMVEGMNASTERRIEPTKERTAFILNHRYSYKGTYNQEWGCN